MLKLLPPWYPWGLTSVVDILSFFFPLITSASSFPSIPWVHQFMHDFFFHRLLTGSILAHEMMHAWLRLTGLFLSRFLFIGIHLESRCSSRRTFSWLQHVNHHLFILIVNIFCVTSIPFYFIAAVSILCQFLYIWRFSDSKSRCWRRYLSGFGSHVVGVWAFFCTRQQLCISLILICIIYI